MDYISAEQTDRLYWLGRYTERVYTTTRLFFDTFDALIDNPDFSYKSFCTALEIPDIYTDKDDFIKRYAFDASNPDSLKANLRRAHDNAIVLRDEIYSDSLGYIELAVRNVSMAELSSHPLIEFQALEDNLMAFWGMIDDIIPDENVRNLIKVGKRVERIDLYARLKRSREDMIREVARLTGRVKRCSIDYDENVITSLNEMVNAEELNYREMVRTIEAFRG